MKDNRRDFIKKGASLAAALSVTGLSGYNESGKKGAKKISPADGQESGRKVVEWPIIAGTDAPKLCVGASPGNTKLMRQIKQIGVDYVLMGGPQIPWTEKSLRDIMDPFKAEGLTVINMMIGGHPNTIFGREGRDEEIRNIQDSLRAAGAAGLPVVEYNFYAHRFMEGYYEIKARGGAGTTGFD
jgi:mannonate dehydratase